MTQTHDQVESISNLNVISSSIAGAVQDVLGGEEGGCEAERATTATFPAGEESAAGTRYHALCFSPVSDPSVSQTMVT